MILRGSGMGLLGRLIDVEADAGVSNCSSREMFVIVETQELLFCARNCSARCEMCTIVQHSYVSRRVYASYHPTAVHMF